VPLSIGPRMPESATQFVVEDPRTGDHFTVAAHEGWLSLIARYTVMPEPRRQRDGLCVLEPRTTEDTMDFLRAVLRPDAARAALSSGQGVTHGRHCPCSACEREDWTRITAPCGMHGASCPAVYAPLSAGRQEATDNG
jgi:hypothetical protein